MYWYIYFFKSRFNEELNTIGVERDILLQRFFHSQITLMRMFSTYPVTFFFLLLGGSHSIHLLLLQSL